MQAFVAFCCGQKPFRLQSSVSESKSPKGLQIIHCPLFKFFCTDYLFIYLFARISVDFPCSEPREWLPAVHLPSSPCECSLGSWGFVLQLQVGKESSFSVRYSQHSKNELHIPESTCSYSFRKKYLCLVSNLAQSFFGFYLAIKIYSARLLYFDSIL